MSLGAPRVMVTPAPGDRGVDRTAIAGILAGGRFRSDGILLETEAMALLDAIGIATPERIELSDAAAAARLNDPPLVGPRVVLKIVTPDLPHKTEAGGVRILDNRREAVLAAALEMERRFAVLRPAGFVLYEFVPHEQWLGHEFLLGVRWSREFGPVVTLGPGGIHAEFLAQALHQDQGVAFASPVLSDPGGVERAIARLAMARLVSEPQRGQPPALPGTALAGAVARLLALAREFVPDPIAEFEVNPLVVSRGRLVALDAMLRFTRAPERAAPDRPLEKIAHLLVPRSIAVVGVSDQMNPGHIILQNILRRGFPPEQVTVVKPGRERLEGCRCVPSLADLPGRVDLVVLSVPALQSAEMTAAIAERGWAESIVLIASGLEERPGMDAPLARMHDALRHARAADWRGPVVNGGNCLGVRSVPGRYDTLFIPRHKLPASGAGTSPLALLAASGAFAVSKISKFDGLDPRYVITLGNQMDLTVSDYLEHLKDDAAIEVFGVYVEGFRLLDGARFLRLTEEISRSGRTVVLYRAGRTRAGADAASCHTAAVAGDYLVTRRLAEAAGALVSDSLEDFEDLVRLATMLRRSRVSGLSLGAASNAGYECVAIADTLGPFRLAEWTATTRGRLGGILERVRLAGIVSVRNPIDLTPILGDEAYEAVVRAILDDPRVDAGVVGCVPLTPALATLASGPGHPDDLWSEHGIVRRLVRLKDEVAKPWVMIVDAGRLYDRMALALQDGGIPTFRTADRALRLFGRYCQHRLRAARGRAGGARSAAATGA
jgi:acyl-CoA synthetase (NDP forming)